MSDFSKLGSLLRDAQNLVWQTNPRLGMASFWEKAAGANIAAHTSVRSFRDGVLTVSCESGGWACELRLAGAELTGRLNRLKPPETVREIRFVHQAQGGWKSRK
jgi:predicted nucleic acid-binding Zn ribbon protein